MKIQILGTRGEIEETHPLHAKHSGVLIDNELLIDLGEKEFLDYNPQWIVLTHLHPDHAYFARWHHEEIPPTKAALYAPEKPQKEVLRDFVQVLNQKKKLGSFTIFPFPTHHSKNVKSQAYLIKKGKKSLLYTGDLVWIDKAYLEEIGEVDLIITEASFLRKGGMIRKDKETGALYGHNGIPNLIHLFQGNTKRILFMHFGAWFYKNPQEGAFKIHALAQEAGLEVIVGYDGLELKL